MTFIEEVKIIVSNGCNIWFLLGKAQTMLSSDNWPQTVSLFVKKTHSGGWTKQHLLDRGLSG